MWMNRDEIERMVEIAEEEMPKILPFVRFLNDWKEIVDENSDGWSSFRAGSKCAEKLMILVKEAESSRRGRGQVPPRELFKRSLASIRSFASKRDFPVPELREAAPQIARHPARGLGM